MRCVLGQSLDSAVGACSYWDLKVIRLVCASGSDTAVAGTDWNHQEHGAEDPATADSGVPSHEKPKNENGNHLSPGLGPSPF